MKLASIEFQKFSGELQPRQWRHASPADENKTGGPAKRNAKRSVKYNYRPLPREEDFNRVTVSRESVLVRRGRDLCSVERKGGRVSP